MIGLALGVEQADLLVEEIGPHGRTKVSRFACRHLAPALLTVALLTVGPVVAYQDKDRPAESQPTQDQSAQVKPAPTQPTSDQSVTLEAGTPVLVVVLGTLTDTSVLEDINKGHINPEQVAIAEVAHDVTDGQGHVLIRKGTRVNVSVAAERPTRFHRGTFFGGGKLIFHVLSTQAVDKSEVNLSDRPGQRAVTGGSLGFADRGLGLLAAGTIAGITGISKNTGSLETVGISVAVVAVIAKIMPGLQGRHAETKDRQFYAAVAQSTKVLPDPAPSPK